MSDGNPRHGADRNLDRNRDAKADRVEGGDRADGADLVVGRAGTPDEGELPPGPDAERYRGEDAASGDEPDESDRSRGDR